jgi:hypothetical protein
MKPKIHLHMTGRVPNVASQIESRAGHKGRPKVNLGLRRKVFKSPVRIPRGTP